MYQNRLAMKNRRVFENLLTKEQFLKQLKLKKDYCKQSLNSYLSNMKYIEKKANGNYELLAKLFNKVNHSFWIFDNNITELSNCSIIEYCNSKPRDMLEYVEFKRDNEYLYCISYKHTCINVDKININEISGSEI